MTKKIKQPDLETSLFEIKSLIDQMEKGELNLEQSLECFERGITLIKHAQKILQTAEQRVQTLIENNKDSPLTDYDKNNNDGNH